MNISGVFSKFPLFLSEGRCIDIYNGRSYSNRNWAGVPVFLSQKHSWTCEPADSCPNFFYKVALTNFLPISKIGDGNTLLTPALGKTLQLADFIQRSA